MSTLQERHEIATAGVHDAADGFATRVVLQPIAAPSILGLAGFAGGDVHRRFEPRGLVGDVAVAARPGAVRPTRLWVCIPPRQPPPRPERL